MEENKELNSEQPSYEAVNHPNHYNRYSVEAVEMARRIWGDDALITAAEITAFFYRMRMGLKPENSVKQELDKEEFWLNYANKLKAARGEKCTEHGASCGEKCTGQCAQKDNREILND